MRVCKVCIMVHKCAQGVHNTESLTTIHFVGDNKDFEL